MDEAPGHAPRLVVTRAPRRPQGAVLLLHGGGGGAPPRAVSPAQPSVLRMWSVAAATTRAGRGRLVVARLLNATRGWDAGAPVRDAHWALDRLAQRFGTLPTSLVGHSLGGRAALVAADRDEVRSVVALAAWLLPGDARHVRGRRVLLVHGTGDRVAPLTRAAAVARDLGAANEVSFLRLEGAGHALLREAWRVDALAADFARATVLDEPGRLAATRRALQGGSWTEAAGRRASRPDARQDVAEAEVEP